MYLSNEDVALLPHPNERTPEDYFAWWYAVAKKYGVNPTPYTDGCSCVPDFDFWGCCVVHDMGYRVAAASPFLFQGAYGRMVADYRLGKCIWRESKRWWLLAPIYWAGVRLFGRFFFKWRLFNWLPK